MFDQQDSDFFKIMQPSYQNPDFLALYLFCFGNCHSTQQAPRTQQVLRTTYFLCDGSKLSRGRARPNSLSAFSESLVPIILRFPHCPPVQQHPQDFVHSIHMFLKHACLNTKRQIQNSNSLSKIPQDPSYLTMKQMSHFPSRKSTLNLESSHTIFSSSKHRERVSKWVKCAASIPKQQSRLCIVWAVVEWGCDQGNWCLASNALYKFSKTSRKSQIVGVFVSQSVENHALPTMSPKRKDIYTKLQA